MVEIKTDILSALSQNGSGLQLQSLAASLVEAETGGERVLTERRLEDANTSISAMGQLSSQVDQFKSGMTRTAESSSRLAFSSAAAVSIEVTQEALASDLSAIIEVTALASPQILTYSFDADVTSSSAITTGTLSLDTDEWSSSADITIDDSNDTLGGLVSALNDVNGLSASLIDTGDGMALIIKSKDGLGNALDSASIAAITGALGLTSNGTEGQTDASENPLGLTSDISAATDAAFSVDGVEVTRSGNTIDDLFPGHRITLNSLGTATLNSSESSTSVRERIAGFIDEVNALKSYLNTATQRGVNGATAGPLAGDSAAQSILNKVRSITTQPILGYGDTPVYLAELGVKTERDGSLSLDETLLAKAMEDNPQIAEALFSTQFSSDDAGVSVSGLAFAPPQPGTYLLVYDPDTGSATLDGDDLSVSTDSDGNILLRSTAADTYGMQFTLANEDALTTNVRYGTSLVDQLESYSDLLIGANGMLARRETELGLDLESFEEQLTSIEAKADMLTERYNIQFGRMEAMIASLKETGEYMESLMDAWNADR
ncbi:MULTISPECIES: flagellar filament capping protein FliD [Planktotalea]|uniref:flagellar filament capping protein FliD n=1 Tax=Planktotalea TaxID=1195766 RepID=UPI000A171A76|nr:MULTISPECIES: flagellar filament capping protein FliD [Planktotalea]